MKKEYVALGLAAAAIGLYYVLKKSGGLSASSLTNLIKTLPSVPLQTATAALTNTDARAQKIANTVNAPVTAITLPATTGGVDSATFNVTDKPALKDITVFSYVSKGVPVTIYPAGASAAIISGGTLGLTSYGAPVYTSGPLAGAAPDSPAAQVWASIVAGK